MTRKRTPFTISYTNETDEIQIVGFLGQDDKPEVLATARPGECQEIIGRLLDPYDGYIENSPWVTIAPIHPGETIKSKHEKSEWVGPTHVLGEDIFAEFAKAAEKIKRMKNPTGETMNPKSWTEDPGYPLTTDYSTKRVKELAKKINPDIKRLARILVDRLSAQDLIDIAALLGRTETDIGLDISIAIQDELIIVDELRRKTKPFSLLK